MTVAEFVCMVSIFWVVLPKFVIAMTVIFYSETSINPLSPNIQIQILQTDLYTFPSRISSENLIKDQGIFTLVIILLILIT